MTIINNPIEFIEIMKKTDALYEALNKESVKVTLSNDFLIFNLFTEEQTLKIEEELKKAFNTEVFTLPMKNMLDELHEKYEVLPASKGFVEDNKYSEFENFILYHKTMLFISWFEKNEIFELSILHKLFKEKELEEMKKKREIFFNSLIEEVLLKAKEKSEYTGLQLRVQDAYFVYYKLNQKNFENFLLELQEKFNTKIDESDVALFWQSKLVTKTNMGIDWKFLNNTVKKIQSHLFRKQMITSTYLTTLNVSLDDYTINDLLGAINNAIRNIKVTEKMWRRYVGYLDYTIYQQSKIELLSNIRDFRKSVKRIRVDNDNLDNIYESVEHTLSELEAVFEVNSLEAINERKLSVSLPMNSIMHVVGSNDKKDIMNVFYQINRICSIYLFSSLNKHNMIYGLSITESKLDSIEFINISFNYSEEINEYMMKKVEKNFLYFLTEVIKKYKVNYDDDYKEYKEIFINFMKECDATVLEGKLLTKALSEYMGMKNGNGKKKI